MSTTSNQTIPKLRTAIRGEVILPSHPDYNKARSIWNGMIDRKPAVIVQCAKATDVIPAIQFARENNLVISILGGGHHIAGNSIVEDGLVIDLSKMKNVTVDPQQRRAKVEPGATLADFDKQTQKYGLATPTGINSTTGISGLTLGGGFGWLSRQHGLTIDNLVSARLITAKGQQLRLSDNENSDLFWAIRGGGGNFGVVTEYEFKLHSVGPDVLAGLLVFPFTKAEDILRQYRSISSTLPEKFNAWVVLRKAPPLPFLSEEVHGKMVVVLAVFYDGEKSEGERLINLIRNLGPRYGEHVGMQPYTGWQQAFDPLLTPGARNYWKSHNFTTIDDGVLHKMIEYAGKMPSDHSEIFVALVSGMANRIPVSATAYSSRDARFVMNVHARWEQPSNDEKCISWARRFFKATAPYASSGAYVNFMTGDEETRVATAYGPNYKRLEQIKTKYDPQNVFHINHNIKPRMMA